MSNLELTILKLTCAEVPTHMIVIIGDMDRNGIQHHAPPVNFVFYCMFLFFQFQRVYSTY